MSSFTIVAANEKLKVAVASNFLLPLKTLKVDFEKNTSVELVLVSASSAKLYAQVIHGAPYDVFLSADKKTIEKLVQDKQLNNSQSFLYAIGLLALWAPGNHDPESAFFSNQFDQLVIANPKLAPYGQAAIQVLNKTDSYSNYAPKIIYAENVGQAFQFVFNHNAPAGFVAYSQVKSKNILTNVWLVPQILYEPLEQYGVILNANDKAEITKKFVQYITSQQVRSRISQEFGYAPFN